MARLKRNSDGSGNALLWQRVVRLPVSLPCPAGWYILQDFFHLGGGIVLLTTAVGLLCTVTTRFQGIQPMLVQLLLESGCPPMKAASCGSLISSEPVGMHILKRVIFIDLAKAIAFAMVLLLIVLTQCLEALNGLDYAGRGIGPVAPAATQQAAPSVALGGSDAVESTAFSCDVAQLSKEARADLLGQIINKLVVG